MNHILVILSREQDGRDATPSEGIIDSQSVKTAENGGPRGYDAGKKIRGRKRHIVTDTLGHVVAAVVHPADVQDRDGAPLAATRIRSLFPWLRHLIGDGGYAGEKLRVALTELGLWTIPPFYGHLHYAGEHGQSCCRSSCIHCQQPDAGKSVQSHRLRTSGAAAGAHSSSRQSEQADHIREQPRDNDTARPKGCGDSS